MSLCINYGILCLDYFSGVLHRDVSFSEIFFQQMWWVCCNVKNLFQESMQRLHKFFYSIITVIFFISTGVTTSCSVCLDSSSDQSYNTIDLLCKDIYHPINSSHNYRFIWPSGWLLVMWHWISNPIDVIKFFFRYSSI